MLLRDGEPVAIGGRAFDVLLRLVTNPGAIVSLSELRRFVWPNMIVDEANLRVQMVLVRRILAQCEQARRAIETITLRGYCFTLPVRHHLRSLASDVPICATRSALPMLPNPIIGRDEAVALIRAALDEHQLVTITGPGGIGKTTVAIETATRYVASGACPVAFLDLTLVSDAAGAMAALAGALGIEPGNDPLAALVEHLQHRAFLLLLDTCEHIVEPISRLAEILLSRCPDLRLLVTSREALRANGEWCHRLASLTFPEQGEQLTLENMASFSATVLFVDRIQASMRFGVQAQDLPLLAEICRRLDGIPLAIEFAAARVADLGLRSIAAHLDDRFKILTRGRRTALPRHRTLAAALDWSFSLLSNDEQCLLRHLARLGGPFTPESAVTGGGSAGCARPTEALASLYEKSLLSVDTRKGSPLYRLLDTTRAYVASVGMDRLSA
jgi:predicted ATPase/DNA-binding winged helix-turn-helix (wHTH) protein